MKIWMSGEIQDDVGHAFRAARNEVEQTLNGAFAARVYGSAVQEWALLPMIVPWKSDRFGEIRKYDKRRKVVEFRLEIDHARFKSATPVQQRSLICDCLLRSVDMFWLLGVDGFDHNAFRTDLERIVAEKGWNELPINPASGQSALAERAGLIAVDAQFGGPELADSTIARTISRLKDAATAVQRGRTEPPGPSVKVIFCVAGSKSRPDWDHGRYTTYFRQPQQVVIEATVPSQVVESESALDALIFELRGANALAFEFYRQNNTQYPLARAEELVTEICRIASSAPQ